MAIGPVVEVLIGLIFVFFVFSLVCSGLNEYIARTLQKRTDFLVAGVWELLNDPRSSHFQRFWAHPLVLQLAQSLQGTKEGWRQRLWKAICNRAHRVLSTRTAKAARLRRLEAEGVVPDEDVRRLPSYIPTATFVTVFDDIVRQEPLVPGSPLQTSYEALKAGATADQLRQNIARWFENQMDRTSGWYKRETKTLLFWLGLLVVLFMNVDTVAIARNLWTNPTARAVVNDAAEAQLEAVRQATATTVAGTPATSPPLLITCDGDSASAAPAATAAGGPTTTTPASAAVRAALDCARSLDLPLGWRLSQTCLVANEAVPEECTGFSARATDVWLRFWRTPLSAKLLKAVGWLMTAAAISFGAPFWFDLLNRFGSLRNAGKPPASTAAPST